MLGADGYRQRLGSGQRHLAGLARRDTQALKKYGGGRADKAQGASDDPSPSGTSPPHLKLPVVCLVSACISAVTAPASSCHPIQPCRSLQSDKESIIELAHEHQSRDCVAPGCKTRPLASAAAPSRAVIASTWAWPAAAHRTVRGYVTRGAPVDTLLGPGVPPNSLTEIRTSARR